MQAIIMAGGEGKRMQSSLPKVLHEIDGEAMLYRIVSKVLSKGINTVYIVCGKHKDTIQNYIDVRVAKAFPRAQVVYVIQSVPMGTGDAVRQCLPSLENVPDDTTFMILNGDTPLIDTTMEILIQCPVPTLMVTTLDNPQGQGRILTDDEGKFTRIVEEKDATEEERKVQTVNCGVYLISLKDMRTLLPQLTNNNSQKEYYLTDICGMLGTQLALYQVTKELQYELLNVNTQDELEKASGIATEVWMKRNRYKLRVIDTEDFDKGYLALMRQLSNTIDDANSKKAFTNILREIYSNPNHAIFVIEDLLTQRVVASTTLLIEPKFIHNGKCVGHIEDVVVSNDYRGKRVASHLVKMVTHIAEVSGNCYKCILDCKDELEFLYGGVGYKRNAIQMSKYF